MTRYFALVCLLPVLMGVSCPPPTPTDGLDLSKRGDVQVTLTRALGRASAEVSAYVLDTGAGLFVLQLLELSSSQVLQVDGVPLSHHAFDIPSWVSASVTAKAPPGSYTVAFNDNGIVRSMQAGAVSEIAIASPFAGATVSKSGFTLTWTPSGDVDVRVNILLEGDVSDPDAAGGVRSSSTSIDDRLDNGSAAIDASRLAEFLPGTLRVSLTRQRRVPQALGFSSGEVRIQATDEREFVLAN